MEAHDILKAGWLGSVNIPRLSGTTTFMIGEAEIDQ